MDIESVKVLAEAIKVAGAWIGVGLMLIGIGIGVSKVWVKFLE